MKLLLLGLGTQEIILLAIVALLFFGGKKIPELMKGIGKGVRSFKDGMNGKEDNNDTESNSSDKNNA
ncbi:MAG: twin-arginine translocase TatA/TatE family subunit [Bacteroidales bacterium]|jgi:sec-independent protein translocase protein TatA|nr:twin-arginine translocase TatA/TatE family subunit [Bacteroidales bacterium]